MKTIDTKSCHEERKVATPASEKSKLLLGGSPEQRKAYEDYAAAFSRGDFDKFSSYYTDDVECQLSSLVLHGKQGIVDFYRVMFPKVRETLIVHQLIADDNGIAIDVTSEFTGLVDATGFAPMPLKKGEVRRVRLFIFYALRDGKISSIRAARLGVS